MLRFVLFTSSWCLLYFIFAMFRLSYDSQNYIICESVFLIASWYSGNFLRDDFVSKERTDRTGLTSNTVHGNPDRFLLLMFSLDAISRTKIELIDHDLRINSTKKLSVVDSTQSLAIEELARYMKYIFLSRINARWTQSYCLTVRWSMARHARDLWLDLWDWSGVSSVWTIIVQRVPLSVLR